MQNKFILRVICWINVVIIHCKTLIVEHIDIYICILKCYMTLIFEVKNLVNCMSIIAILCDLLELSNEWETNNDNAGLSNKKAGYVTKLFRLKKRTAYEMDLIHTKEIINKSETIIKMTVDVVFGAFKTKKDI